MNTSVLNDTESNDWRSPTALVCRGRFAALAAPGFGLVAASSRPASGFSPAHLVGLTRLLNLDAIRPIGLPSPRVTARSETLSPPSPPGLDAFPNQ